MAPVRQIPHIKGIQTLNIHHKISLYADDILLYLHHSSHSLPEAVKVIDPFSKLADHGTILSNAFHHK